MTQEAIETLQQIAKLANLLTGHACCDWHEYQWKCEIEKLLSMFEDDSYQKLKDKHAGCRESA